MPRPESIEKMNPGGPPLPLSPPFAFGDTVADLLRHLGDIAPQRVLMQPLPGQATVADAHRLHTQRENVELIDGTLVRKVMGYSESILAVHLLFLLQGFVRERNLGLVSGPDGTMQLLPGLVRIPDVAFVSWARLEGRRPTEAIPLLVPDLAVEILSAGNTPGEMARKRQHYFAAGVRLVWEIDPDTRHVSVYHPDQPAVVLGVGQCLDGGDVLPGFALPLADLFAELDRHGE
jgi:Uma2 family endonuclease